MEIIQILELQFTPEEAALALYLTPLPQKLSDIAKSAGMEENKVRTILETMADKGLVHAVSGKEELKGLYRLPPTAPGIFETSIGKGAVDPRTEHLRKIC